MSKPLTLIARVVKQGDYTFYETAIPALDLIDEERFQIDRWNNTSQKGYQRENNEHHSRRIARYLEMEDNMMPQGIVINVRGTLNTRPITGVEGVVQLELATNEIGYIVDGQHRIDGVRRVQQANLSLAGGGTDLSDYEFGVTILHLPIEREMRQFKNLNGTANRPAKGLGQVIGYQLQTMTGELPATLSEMATNSAVGMAVRLSTDSDSPLFGRVALGGIRKRSFHTTVQSAVVNALLPMFISGRYSDVTKSPQYYYDYTLSFLKSVERTWPEAVGNPDSFNILRSDGLSVLFKLLSRIFNNLTITPSDADFDEVLSGIKDAGFGDEAWSTSPRSLSRTLRGGYSTNRGNAIVADYMWALVHRRSA